MTITCANPETYEQATEGSREVRPAAGTHGRLDGVLRDHVPRPPGAASAATFRDSLPNSRGGRYHARFRRAYLVESIPKGFEDLRGTPGVQYTEDVLVR